MSAYEICVMTFADQIGCYDTIDEAVAVIIADVVAWQELYKGDENEEFQYPGGPVIQKFRTRLRLVVLDPAGERVN